MSKLVFGDFAVDMTDPEFFGLPIEPLLQDLLAGNGFIQIASSRLDFTSFGGNGHIAIFGSFNLSARSEQEFLNTSRITRMLFETSSGARLVDIQQINIPLSNFASVDAFLEAAAVVIGGSQNDILSGLLGADNIQGGAGDDILFGQAGNDKLDGGSGADQMIGGPGNDQFVVDDARDHVVEQAAQGIDLVRSAISYYLPRHVENLILLDPALSGTGNELANVITGNAQANVLDGQGGADTLIGGAGNDTYHVDHAKDKAVETLAGAAGGLQDRVIATVSFVLGANLEHLTLAAGAGDIDGTGNGLANQIIGNEGDNRLDGKGGADSMAGGLGDDTYVVDHAGDVVTENADEGSDTIVIGRTVDLIELPGIENVTLSGTGGFAVTGDAEDNVLIGNAGHNTLTGNAGNDTLDGKGGRDNMWGGPGDDIYYVNLPGDGVNESFDQGTDTVRSTISFTLEHLPYVENVELLGAGPLFALGNAAPNRLVGNAGMNSLNGQGGNDILEGGAGIDLLLGGDGDDELYGGDGDDGLHGGAGNDLLDGGAGADIMTGGPGDDLFIFDDPGDMALEVPGGGNDTIRSSATVEHGFLGVERIELTGADHIDASGGAGDEVIVGNSANNSLNGGGGADTLEGGDGDDRFVFDRTDTYNGQLGSVTGGAGFDMLAFTLANGVFASGYAASGIEGIDLTAAGAQTLSITAQDVVDFADSDEIRVLGNQDDVLVFSEPWNLLGTEEIAGALYYRYEAGAATLFVDTDIIVQS